MKICTAKAISAANCELYLADLSVTYAKRIRKRRGAGKKEKKLTLEASLLLLLPNLHSLTPCTPIGIR
jgi:hypothetical protein